jgi:hypothetical protein
MPTADRFNQYAQDDARPADTLYERARAAAQYTQDVPTTTSTDFSYRNPQHPHLPQPRGQVTSPFGQGAAPTTGGGGGGGRAALSVQQKKHMTGEEFQRQWAESEQRADRIRDSLNGRPWGHPQD